MWGVNRGWNLLSKRKPHKEDYWLWGIWVGVALIAIAVLPFSARLGAMADAVLQFCGIGIRQ